MSVPAGVILIWPGANSAIPTGWQRETALDGRYPKGHGAENPNVQGGSNTHSHSGSHGHTLNHHAHTFNSGYGNENSSQQCSNEDQGNTSSHTHSVHTITSTSGGSLNSTSVTWGSVNNEPPYHKVIFIKPQSAVAILSDGILAHYNGSSLPLGFSLCDGSNGTPDLRGKYLKGADSGADAGATGGSLNHSHDVSHTHSVNPHSHSGSMSGIGAWYGGRGYATNPTGAFCHKDHSHTVTLNNTTDTINSYSGNGGGSDSVEPAYKKLSVIKNTSGSPNQKIGLIGLWLGSIASIPKNWQVCDGSNGTPDLRDKFIKTGQNLTENGNTGGSNTHTHTPVSHSHTSTGNHSHSGSHGTANMQSNPGGTNQGVCYYDHVHAIQNISSVTPSYSSDNIGADTISNQPAYTTVAYIQLMKLDPAGALLLHNFL